MQSAVPEMLNDSPVHRCALLRDRTPLQNLPVLGETVTLLRQDDEDDLCIRIRQSLTASAAEIILAMSSLEPESSGAELTERLSTALRALLDAADLNLSRQYQAR